MLEDKFGISIKCKLLYNKILGFSVNKVYDDYQRPLIRHIENFCDQIAFVKIYNIKNRKEFNKKRYNCYIKVDKKYKKYIKEKNRLAELYAKNIFKILS